MNHALISETDNAFKKHDFKLVKLASLVPPNVGPTTGWDYVVMGHLQEARPKF